MRCPEKGTRQKEHKGWLLHGPGVGRGDGMGEQEQEVAADGHRKIFLGDRKFLTYVKMAAQL